MEGHTTAPLTAVWLGSGQCGVQQWCKPLLQRKEVCSPLCLSSVCWRAYWLTTQKKVLRDWQVLPECPAPPSSHTLTAWMIPPSLAHYIWVTLTKQLSAPFEPCEERAVNPHKPGCSASNFCNRLEDTFAFPTELYHILQQCHRQLTNKQTWLYSNKALFTKTGRWIWFTCHSFSTF